MYLVILNIKAKAKGSLTIEVSLQVWFKKLEK